MKRFSTKAISAAVAAFVVSSCATKPVAVERDVASETAIPAGALAPFTSDGCSRFPDGIPFFDPKLWLPCCVKHDIAYWAGGTAEQKLAADQVLRKCVREKAGPTVADIVFLGVRAGGHPDLPTTWRWGYGWPYARGYRALSEAEQTQVEQLTSKIPNDLSQIPIRHQRVIPTRVAWTGDYCLDLAATFISSQTGLDQELQPLPEHDVVTERADGYWRETQVKAAGCDKPYKFTFQLLRKNACRTRQSELLARGRVRLIKAEPPPECKLPAAR